MVRAKRSAKKENSQISFIWKQPPAFSRGTLHPPMAEQCPHCGATLDANAAKCPACHAETIIPLPGTGVGAEGDEVTLPAPESSAVEQGSTSGIEDLFDDFDPMAEFAPPSGVGEDLATFAGLNLTPPPPAGQDLAPPASRPADNPGDDVLDFIDTGFDPPTVPSAPTLPPIDTGIERIGFEESAQETLAHSHPSTPPAPSLAAGDEAVAVVAPPDPSPAMPPAPAAPVAEAPLAEAQRPPARPKRRFLLLGVAVGLLGGFGIGAYFLFLGPSTPRSAPATVAKPPKAPPAEKKVAAAEPEKEAVPEGKPAEAAAGTDKEEVDAAEPTEPEKEVAAEMAEGEEAPSSEEEAAAEEPADPFAEAEALEREEKWEEALAAYQALVRPEGEHVAEAHLRRSRILSRLGEPARAALEAKRALAADESRLDLHLHYGALLEKTGGLRDAVEVYETALAGREGEVAILEPLCRLYLATGTPWKAIALLEPQVKAGGPPALRLLLGEAYLGAGAWGRAAETLEPLKNDSRAAYPLGRALLERGQTRAAIPYLERAAKRGDVDPVVHRHLGYAYKEQGRRADAVRAFRSYLEAEPEAVDRREIEDEITTLAR